MLVFRASANQPVRAKLWVAEATLGEVSLVPGWEEYALRVPSSTPTNAAPVRVEILDGDVTTLHYWSYAALGTQASGKVEPSNSKPTRTRR